MNKRNVGKTTGKFLGSVLDSAWNIYETATGYRASSVASVLGKANYTFAIKDKKFNKDDARDSILCQDERPELYAAIEQFFNAPDAPLNPMDDDEFGDLARTQRRPFTQAQQWKRGLLYMRMYELERAAKGDAGEWDAGIRLTWSGIFKFKIDDDNYNKALEYITDHGPVELNSLLAVLREYYDGKYGPYNCRTLEEQFNAIAGKPYDIRDFS